MSMRCCQRNNTEEAWLFFFAHFRPCLRFERANLSSWCKSPEAAVVSAGPTRGLSTALGDSLTPLEMTKL